MQLIEQNNFDFKAQLDNPKWLHSIKCVLLEQDQDPEFLTHKIKQEHLKPLFNDTDNELMTAEVENDSIYIQMVFRIEGVYFECSYNINLKTGEVCFAMDKPCITNKDYAIPKDMNPELAKKIKEMIKPGKLMDSMNDDEYIKYFSSKFMPVFLDYAKYLEGLVMEKNCEGCVYLYKHQLSRVCEDFYTKNKF